MNYIDCIVVHKQYQGSIVHFTVRGKLAGYIPGQYVVINWGGGIFRSYSISEYQVLAEGEISSASFWVQLRDGQGSNRLRAMQVGDHLDIMGPLGEFKVIDDAQVRHLMWQMQAPRRWPLPSAPPTPGRW